ncbi:FAD-dependent oxidoreductase [Bordetella genomosp. 11]|uniref:D-amino-acid oxidase n=1 Tax=Bordetella genomosp. 11 TaxID=1416808 RepID=A0A261UHP0_9BORD|nr:FAD-dependent oxidoreductase [Bordetella genomosp. 11]OZI61459.1 D-amino-acid oxidase [Bordetella genomosp. 11]
MQRRRFLRQAAATLALSSAPALVLPARNVGTASRDSSAPMPASASCLENYADVVPIQARTDRITDVRVGLRPFRHAGPRVETQVLGAKTIVHNYGHGGAGWSLSWGSSTLALRLAQAAGARSIAVIGGGAMGLTSAVLARQAGLPVCIYTKAPPLEAYSMAATGLWTPDSQLCDAAHASALAERWKTMAATSFARYQNLLGLPGKPIEWIRGYSLSDTPFALQSDVVEGEPRYGRLRDRSRDFIPRFVDLCATGHPFPQPYVRRWTTLMFNISAYAHMLITGFLGSGGCIKVVEFVQAADLLDLPEDVVINATGYGARQLFSDESIIPIRGQTARLVPQQEVTYGLSTHQFNVVPRSDGLVVRSKGHGGDYNNSDDTPDVAESETAVRRLGEMFENMPRGRPAF